MTERRLEHVVAIVPVKELRDSKSRLGATIQATLRAELVLAALRTVLAALTAPAIVTRVVVSPDRDVLDAARTAGAVGLVQTDHQGDALNGALEQARQHALAEEPQAVLIVLGDLPLLTSRDIAAMLELAAFETVAVIAPDRHETGTNALLLRPPGVLPFAFGAASCQRHLALANQRGLATKLFRSPSLAFDLDTPADLVELTTRRPDLARVLALDGARSEWHA